MAGPVYGIHAVEALLARDPASIVRLQVQRGREDRRVAALLAAAEAAGVAIHRVPRSALDRLVQGRHQGVVAELIAGPAGLDKTLAREADLWVHLDALDHAPLLLVLDGVTDPHNLGACLRSADAAGVDAVILPKDKSASVTPVVRKVACGAAETVPLHAATNLARVLKGLKERGIWLYGTAGEAGSSLYAQDLTGPVALVLGAEGAGLRRLTRAHCDFLVHLPMAGAVSSLNVSVAAGVCLFEAVRQRAAAG
ncbi:MAG: 23S rRNA (guanosine(2251)-2'-O)-methyltransferase RlmB [Pseudohaliea sp.]